jgi:hypothetical protein
MMASHQVGLRPPRRRVQPGLADDNRRAVTENAAHAHTLARIRIA